VTPAVLADALSSPAVTVILTLVFSALIVIVLTAGASALLWIALQVYERLRRH
jgi:hypothetical protein